MNSLKNIKRSFLSLLSNDQHFLENPFLWFNIIAWSRKKDFEKASDHQKEGKNQLGEINYPTIISSSTAHVILVLDILKCW